MAVERLDGAYAQMIEEQRLEMEEEEARQQRMAAVVRDGNTLYRHPSFERVGPQVYTPTLLAAPPCSRGCLFQ